MKKQLKFFLYIILSVILGGCVLFILILLPIEPSIKNEAMLGYTFSPRAATFLQLNWKEVYDAALKELQPDIIRIPVYWNVLERARDNYDWSDVDYMVDRLENSNTKFILVVGHKQPRWPECHLPDWVDGLSKEEITLEMFDMISDVVNRYKQNPNLYSWQVENEALFPFGECPSWSKDRNLLKREIELVKKIDDQHIVSTSDSGELSTWLKTSTLPIDALSISLYRVVYNQERGYFHWPVNPLYYGLHIKLIKFFVNEVYISELQMEPWGPQSVDKLSREEAYKSFNPIDFGSRIDFAQKTGAKIILAWGVEWWYYMKEKQNDNLFWMEAIKNFSE